MKTMLLVQSLPIRYEKRFAPERRADAVRFGAATARVVRGTKFGQVLTLTLGAGIGVSFKLTDRIKVFAYYVETEFLIFGMCSGSAWVRS